MPDQIETLATHLLASPESIRWTERYAYGFDLSANPDCRSTGEPSAQILFTVPYDGYISLPRFAAQAASGHRMAGATRSQIGLLALSAPRVTIDDLAAAAPEVYPLVLAVQDPLLPQAEHLWADEAECVLALDYQPPLPRTDPLDVEMDVYDDETAPVTRLSEFLSLARALRAPTNSLILDVTVRAHVPNAEAGELPDKLDVCLEQLAFRWPAAAPRWQLDLEDLSGAKPAPLAWHYNPETHSVECGGVRLLPERSKMGARHVTFAAHLRLTLRYPGELMGADVMSGQLRVVLRGVALSGREMAVFDAAGRQWPTEQLKDLLVCQTELAGDFALRLAGRFSKRVTSTYRRLHFAGVTPDSLRQGDVEAVLRDLGYQNIEVHTPQPGETDWNWRIDCRRWEPAERSVARLTLLGVEEARGRTRREQAAPGGLSVSTVFPTSSLTLHVWGRLTGGSGSLANGLNAIQALLKDRFRNVALFR